MIFCLYGMHGAAPYLKEAESFDTQQAFAWISFHMDDFKKQQKLNREKVRKSKKARYENIKRREESWRKQGLLRHTYANDLSSMYGDF